MCFENQKNASRRKREEKLQEENKSYVQEN